ncbi:fimbria/pilus outer membrane usher protein, partial [Vibrio diabolicus]|nr:fimbria/pilus outer membrane usher protein [Vibrio diabolicus]
MFYLNANVYRAQSRHVSYSDTQGWQSTDASQDENGWSVGISIPLGNSHTVSMQSRHTVDRYAQTLSYAGRDNARNANYRLAFDEYEGESVGVSGNYQRNFAYVSTSLGGSVQSDAYKQVNASASGTVLMTQHG